MHKYFSLSIALLFTTVIAFAQKLNHTVTYVSNTSNDKSIIFYGNKKLTWDDFIGKADMSSEAAAITSAGFGFGAGFKQVDGKTSLTITVNCNFNKTKSWVKDGRKTAYILNHEQHHFDIAFISTLQFIKKLNEAKFTTDNYKTLLPEIYNTCAQNMSDLQDQYDTETSNGRIKKKQEEWDEKINTLLASLNADGSIL